MMRERERERELARSVMGCHEEQGLVPRYYLNEARNGLGTAKSRSASVQREKRKFRPASQRLDSAFGPQPLCVDGPQTSTYRRITRSSPDSSCGLPDILLQLTDFAGYALLLFTPVRTFAPGASKSFVRTARTTVKEILSFLAGQISLERPVSLLGQLRNR